MPFYPLSAKTKEGQPCNLARHRLTPFPIRNRINCTSYTISQLLSRIDTQHIRNIADWTFPFYLSAHIAETTNQTE